MVTEKSDRLQKYIAMSFFFQAENRIFNPRTQPCSAGHALALKCEGPVFRSHCGFARHKQRGFFCLALIRIAVRDSALGDTVRSKDDRNIFRLRLTTRLTPTGT